MVEVFKLHLSATQVRVEQSPRGEPHQALTPPFDPLTARALLQILEKGDLQRCRLEEPELVALNTLGLIQAGRLLGSDARNRLVGQRLYEALFPASADPDADVRGALHAALDQARQNGETVPLQLRFDRDAVDLARLPWELVCDADGPLMASGRLRLTRYITFGQATFPFPVADRLEILLITARPEDTPPLDPLAEREAIRQALRGLEAGQRVRVHSLLPPTLDALAAAVNARPYHVVHFDGHGAFARRCPFCGQFQRAEQAFCSTAGCGAPLSDAELVGCLAFEQSAEDRRAQLVDARELATVLGENRVRLFVASACQSATVGGLSVFSSVGPRLILDVPAVVAMQFSVPVDSAAAFAGQFYAALAQGKSIAAAAAAGRRMLFTRGTWYIPAVYLRNRDGEGHLFRLQDSERVRGEVIGGDARGTRLYLRPAGAPPPDWAALRPAEASPYPFLSSYETTDKAVFFGREKATAQLVAELLHRATVVLHGPPGMGKTSLVQAGLIPALLQHGYLVLSVREYGDPLEQWRQAIAASPAFEVDLRGVQDLHSLAAALVRDLGRPLVLVLDEFEDFLRAAAPDRRRSLVEQFAACAQASYPLPVSLLMVVSDDFLGQLRDFQAAVPELWHGLFPLGPLERKQAEAALVQPLTRHTPPLAYAPDFLQHTLLPDLAAQEGGEAINPTHLQIVARELYQAARQSGAAVIGSDQYPAGGTAGILSRYLEQALRQRFPETERRTLARALLKQMVASTGERRFIMVGEAAEALGQEVGVLQGIADVLLEDGLLELRASAEDVPTYSLSHDLLVAEVQRWFDREEALARCAQETLERSWDDWRAQRQTAGPGALVERELLIGPERLEELETWRQRLSIDGPAFCLLLRSAVQYRAGTVTWVRHLQQDEGARQLLVQVNRGVAEPMSETVRLAAEALGLDPSEIGDQALARAAVAHLRGSVRRTAALALAALGLDALHAALPMFAQASPPGRPWRTVQALAQIKAAEFPLPQLPLALLARVNLWQAGIWLAEARWPLVAQAVGAGLGGGLGLMLPMALIWLLAGYNNLGVIASYLFVGGWMGVWFAVGRWLLDVLSGHPAGRVAGGGLGFVLGLAALWPFIPNLRGAQWLGAFVAGASVALGWELAVARSARLVEGGEKRPRWALWRAGLGGALGGMLAFAATTLVSLRLPFVLDVTSPVVRVLADIPASAPQDASVAVSITLALAVLAGAAMGAGLVTGGAEGQTLWERLSARRQF